MSDIVLFVRSQSPVCLPTTSLAQMVFCISANYAMTVVQWEGWWEIGNGFYAICVNVQAVSVHLGRSKLSGFFRIEYSLALLPLVLSFNGRFAAGNHLIIPEKLKSVANTILLHESLQELTISVIVQSIILSVLRCSCLEFLQFWMVDLKCLY